MGPCYSRVYNPGILTNVVYYAVIRERYGSLIQRSPYLTWQLIPFRGNWSPGSARVDVDPRFASDTGDAPIPHGRRRSNSAEKAPTDAVACWTTCCCFVPMLRFEAKPGLHAVGRRSWPRAWDGRLPRLGLLRRETHDVTGWAWKHKRSSLSSTRDTPPGFFGSSCKYAIGQGVTRSAEARTIFRSGHGLRHRGQRKPHY